MDREDGEWTVGSKRRWVEPRQGGASEAGEEGGSEANRTKAERMEGGRDAGQKKEKRVDPSNQVRHSRRTGPV